MCFYNNLHKFPETRIIQLYKWKNNINNSNININNIITKYNKPKNNKLNYIKQTLKSNVKTSIIPIINIPKSIILYKPKNTDLIVLLSETLIKTDKTYFNYVVLSVICTTSIFGFCYSYIVFKNIELICLIG